MRSETFNSPFSDRIFTTRPGRCGFAVYSPRGMPIGNLHTVDSCDLHSNRTGSPNFALFYAAVSFSSIEVTVVSDVNFPLTNLL